MHWHQQYDLRLFIKNIQTFWYQTHQIITHLLANRLVTIYQPSVYHCTLLT